MNDINSMNKKLLALVIFGMFCIQTYTNTSTSITIEAMKLDDVEQTESVFYRGFMQAYGHYKPEQIGIQGNMDEYLKAWFVDHCHHVKRHEKPTHLLAAKKDNCIVGYIVFEELESQGSIYLYSIAVDPEMHGKGIGKLLIKSMIDSVPAKKIIVHTRNVNAASITFYKKLGFVESDCISPYYQELAHVLVGFELNVKN